MKSHTYTQTSAGTCLVCGLDPCYHKEYQVKVKEYIRAGLAVGHAQAIADCTYLQMEAVK